MAKHKCPECTKRFDYKRSGWQCPYCGFIILGSTESSVIHQERIEREHKKQRKKKNASDLREYLRKRTIRSVLMVAVVGVLLLGIGICMKVPDIIDRQQKSSGQQEIELLEGQMNKLIHIGSFTVRITEAFQLRCDELPEPKASHYLAVRYQTSGQNKDDAMQHISDIAWAGLHDITSDTYLLPLHTSDLTGSDAVSKTLVSSGVANSLDRTEGILIFLVTDTNQSYELCLFAGEENGYSQYDVLVNTRYTIPLTITEQAGEIIS